MIEDKKIVTGAIVIQVIFVITGFVLAALTISGFKFTVEVFSDPTFYISSTISFIVMMMTFQITKNTTYLSKRADQTSPYYQIVSAYDVMLKMIEKNKWEEKVEEASIKATEQGRIEAIDKTLKRYTNKIDNTNYESMTKEEIIEIAHQSLIRPKKLIKVVSLCRQGIVKYQKINYLDILIDIEYDDNNYHSNEMKMNMTKFNLKESYKRAIWFVITTALINALVFRGFSEDLVVSLVSQAFLILSSSVAGLFSGERQLLYRKQIINNRVVFLNRALDLKTIIRGDE